MVDEHSPRTPTATASVATDAAQRFAKQLASHLGRRAEVREEPDGTRVMFGNGSCLMQSLDTTLELAAVADDDEALDRVTDIVGRHLERFGQRSGLTVVWLRT